MTAHQITFVAPTGAETIVTIHTDATDAGRADHLAQYAVAAARHALCCSAASLTVRPADPLAAWIDANRRLVAQLDREYATYWPQSFGRANRPVPNSVTVAFLDGRESRLVFPNDDFMRHE